jgi:hypothetical protein
VPYGQELIIEGVHYAGSVEYQVRAAMRWSYTQLPLSIRIASLSQGDLNVLCGFDCASCATLIRTDAAACMQSYR